MHNALAVTSEGPEFEDAIVMRLAGPHDQRVFGRDLVEAGQECHVMDANAGDAVERRRRHCLPAIVVRCVEYREFGPLRDSYYHLLIGQSRYGDPRRRESSGSAVAVVTSLA